MPTDLTGVNAQPEITYRLRDAHAKTGELLWAWDSMSRDYGFCEGQAISHQTINATERLILCVEGPPATVFTVGVSSLQFNQRGAVPPGPPGTIDFQLLAGQGRAASLLSHVAWTPYAFLPGGDQAWIFQETRRLASTWWLFATVQNPQGAPLEQQIEIRVLVSRGTPTILTPQQVGPGVVVIP